MKKTVDVRDKVVDVLKGIIGVNREEIERLIEIPKESKIGDYAFPCFSMAGKFRKNPAEIANNIAGKLMEKLAGKKVEEIEKVEAVNGYVNFFVNKELLASSILAEIQKKREKYGEGIVKEKVMVEFSQANTHKAFHVGHVRGTSLGESISRILEFSGNKVIRANYQGDVGMHVAKWLWCYMKYHSKEKLKKDEAWVAKIYVEAVKRLNEKPEFQEEVDEINRKLELRADKKLNRLWEDTRKISLDSLKKIYDELDTRFDHYFFESELEKKGREISKELTKKGIARVSDGATIIDLEKYNLGVWVLLRKDGTVLYPAKDLALVDKKFRDYKIDKAIYVVGSEQKMHLQQLEKTLELMKFKQGRDCKFVHFDLVRLPTGKMSSRTGENILYSTFKDELISYARKEIKKRHKLSGKEIEERALAIAIASMKYPMLKQDPNKVIIFDKAEAMKFEGDTGPYLLYSYARARSVLRKAKYNKKKKYAVNKLNDVEKSLIFSLSKFNEVVEHAYSNLAPNIIANYAFQIAQRFNEFYHSNKIIGSENEEFRLALVNAFSIVMKNALNMLGIGVVERM